VKKDRWNTGRGDLARHTQPLTPPATLETAGSRMDLKIATVFYLGGQDGAIQKADEHELSG
jgi:hypothetical protein